MDLRHDIETLLVKNAGNPLADYLALCLNAFPNHSYGLTAIAEELDRRKLAREAA